MSNLYFSAMDGDQLVDFYWIDPVQQQPGSYCSVLHPSHRAYAAQGSHSSLIVALRAEEIAADQSPGHGLYPPAWDI